MLNRARERANRKDLPFDITVDDIEIGVVCPVLGVRYEPNHVDNSPSLDRLKPELGYVKGNVRVISMRANRIKSNATASELEIIAAWLRNQLDDPL